MNQTRPGILGTISRKQCLK